MAEQSIPDLVVVGRVRRPHGVRGEVAVEVLTDNPDRFRAGSELAATGPGAAPPEVLRVAASRRHHGALLVSFDGLGDRAAAERLRGAELCVRSDEVEEAPEGTYYYFDLVGCSCVDRSAGELGEVVAVREDGGGLLLEISDGRRAVLVPFVNEYLGSVSIADKRIDFELPEGLLETCASPS